MPAERRVYLDNAASTPLSPEAFEAMRPYLLEQYGNPSSTHAHGRALRHAIEQSRRTIAQCLGASPSELVFTSGGTEADNIAILGTVQGLGIGHAISARTEHHAVLHPLEELAAAGLLEVHWLDVDAQGHIDLVQLQDLLARLPRCLVSLMYGNNETGTLHDVQQIGTLCRAHDAVFHSDTVQAMGHLPIDLAQLPIDLLTASAHKFYGPKGCGFLYVRKGLKLAHLMSGGGQERNLRPGTEYVPGIVGMARALAHCYETLDTKNAHLRDLKQYMQAGLLARFPGVVFNGDMTPEGSLPTVLNAALPGGEDDCMLLFNLDLRGVSASGGSACGAGALMGSHVLHAQGLPAGRIQHSIRFSFGVQNQREDIDYALAQLQEIVPTPVI
ncbi:MAG: cysteine desulfurase family protein [Bacteroidia bacterium]